MQEKHEGEIQLQLDYEAWNNIKNTEGGSFNDFMHVDDDIITSEFPTDEDIVELYRSESKSVELDDQDDSENGLEEDDSEKTPQQTPSNEMVANSLSVLRSYLKANEDTTDTLYHGLNNIEVFFETHNKKKQPDSQITDFSQPICNAFL